MSNTVELDIRGQRFGDLVAEYHVGRRVACRCRCGRLVFIAAEELASGAVTSCGCAAPSLLQTIQQKKLAVELRRIINFSSHAGSRR
jgi:hypothetical protein